MEYKKRWQMIEDEFNCNHEDSELRKRPTSNQFVKQCLDCGWTGPAISHSTLRARDMESALLVDDTIRSKWYDKRRERSTELRNSEKNEWLKEHNDYLRSPEWKERRVKVLRRDGYICQACIENPAQEVHHLSYDHWGNEPLFELVAVCKPCHEKITTMDRNGNPGYTGEIGF